MKNLKLQGVKDASEVALPGVDEKVRKVTPVEVEEA